MLFAYSETGATVFALIYWGSSLFNEVNNLDCLLLNNKMTNELERVWKEVTVAYFKTLS
jgi:hypothetical protein